ncbi:MAG TPA: hypothetical protein VFB45_05230 [Pseudolabrys sp.]|nr:hypothetical protein [Pseudolabrys sp.]
MRRLPGWLPRVAIWPLAVLVNIIAAGTASAHVKWFCAYDQAGQPRGLENVLCPDFEFLVGLSILGLMAGALFEGTTIGAAMLRAIDRATRLLYENSELVLRAACGFFFISIWAVGGVLLTPELKTSAPIVGAIHLGIAASMLSRRTMPLGGLGIATLFAIATWQYGAFHLADYPIFLGVAGYLVLVGLGKDELFGMRPVDVLRWTAGITLMWASIEKWAYPEWSFPLLLTHPRLTLGLDPEFYMRAAGAVEFALAFALIWTPLVRRVAAVMLTGMFVSAVAEFGKIDMIGHTLIVAVLLALIADRGSEHKLVRHPWLAPVGYASALAAFLSLYYVAHAAIYGTSVL